MRRSRPIAAWALGLALLAVVAWLAAVAIAYETVPSHNTDQQHFDTIIVLGTPALPDGQPSPEMRSRVDEGVREYSAGVAPHLIMTGGAAHNTQVEAHVMAQLAESEGVPAQAVVEENHAHDTIQNIWYSHEIMSREGWHSAEVVSSPHHLPRTALILGQYTGPDAFQWRTHAAPWPSSFSAADRAVRVTHEAIGCLKLREHGFPSRRFFPSPSNSSTPAHPAAAN